MPTASDSIELTLEAFPLAWYVIHCNDGDNAPRHGRLTNTEFLPSMKTRSHGCLPAPARPPILMNLCFPFGFFLHLSHLDRLVGDVCVCVCALPTAVPVSVAAIVVCHRVCVFMYYAHLMLDVHQFSAIQSDAHVGARLRTKIEKQTKDE